MIVKNPPRLPSVSGLSKYLQSDLFSWMQDVKSGINGKLNFDENFPSFLADNVVIEAEGTAEIPNPLRVVPNERYIVRQKGDAVITDGNWDINTLRLINNGKVSVTISVRFFFVSRR